MQIESLPVSGSFDSFKLSFKPEEDVRQIRLTAKKNQEFGSDANVRLGKLSILYGEETRSEVESVRVTETKVTFGNLDAKGKYVVTVVPQPSEGDALGATSPVVDLATVIFRKTGAVPLSEVKDDFYVSDFSGLATMTADFEARSVRLDYWQFGKGSGEPEKLLYTAGTNRTTGGVYAFCDKDRTPESFMLGTLATSTYGCSVGIAFRNDTDAVIHAAVCEHLTEFRRRVAVYAEPYAAVAETVAGLFPIRSFDTEFCEKALSEELKALEN